jgi:hypothetical protein
MKNYLSKHEQKKEERVVIPLFSDKQKNDIHKMSKKADAEIKRQEDEKTRIEEEKIEKMKIQLLERRECYENMASKTFKNNQQARRFHDSMKPKGTRGWLCNFTSTIHSCPAGCCEPWHGGYWLV